MSESYSEMHARLVECNNQHQEFFKALVEKENILREAAKTHDLGSHKSIFMLDDHRERFSRVISGIRELLEDPLIIYGKSAQDPVMEAWKALGMLVTKSQEVATALRTEHQMLDEVMMVLMEKIGKSQQTLH